MISDEEIFTLAQELLRRRILTQQKDGKNDVQNAVCQTTLLAMYGRQPTIDDLTFSKDYLDFITEDELGFKVRVVSAKEGEDWRVWSNQLDGVDRICFARYYPEDKAAFVFGWMNRVDVEETPVNWFERDGKRVSYWHSIDESKLNPMGDEFKLEDSCSHGKADVWDAESGGWRCLICDRIHFDTKAQETFAHYGKLNIPRASSQTAA